MRKGLALILSAISLSTPSFAGKLNLKGTVSATAFKEFNGSSAVKLTDAAIELSKDCGFLSLNGAVGSILTPTLIKPTKELLKGNFGVEKNDRFGLLWGSLSLLPRKDFQVEVGILTTMVGQELPLTTDNKNIAFGLLWNSQPFIYRGVRAYYRRGDYLFYSEYDFGWELNGSSRDRALGLGILKDKGSFNFSFNYFDYKNYKALLDFNLGKEWKDYFASLSVDYHWLKENPSKKAVGGALYLGYNLTENFSLPLRIEAVKDFNDSNIYGFNSTAYSFTITPTYKLKGKATLRGELGVVKTGSKTYGEEAFQVAFSF